MSTASLKLSTTTHIGAGGGMLHHLWPGFTYWFPAGFATNRVLDVLGKFLPGGSSTLHTYLLPRAYIQSFEHMCCAGSWI